MSAVELKLYISYAQLAVGTPGEALNMWTPTHYNQGFSWRQGSVSFRTLSETASAEVQVATGSSLVLPPETVRAIVVPFVVGEDGLEVGTVTDVFPVAMPAGAFELLYAARRVGTSEIYHLRFVANPVPTPRILIADADMAPPPVLCMEAEPAL